MRVIVGAVITLLTLSLVVTTSSAQDMAQTVQQLALQSSQTAKPMETSSMLGDVRFTLGLQTWINQWQTGSINANPTLGNPLGRNTTGDSSIGWLVIPGAKISYQNFFLSGSYAFSPTEYHFGKTTDVVDQGPGAPALFLQTRTSASREEPEVTAGYQLPFLPGLALTLGYKGVFQHYTNEQVILPINGYLGQDLGRSHFTARYNGVVVGFNGAAELGHGFALTGRAVGGPMWVDCHPSCRQLFSTGTYAAGEAGVGYRLPNLPLSFSVSYKLQVIDTGSNAKTQSSGDVVDLTHGLAIGVSYSW